MRKKIYHNYYQSLFKKLIKREGEIKDIRSAGQIEKRKERIKKEFLELTGGGYENNKLISAKVVGELNQADYKIEKVIYEALPDYFVPANLYLPQKSCVNKRAALLLPVGHDPLGKASEEYQKLAANLAKKGYIAFIYDPVGQGERDLLPHRIKERARRDMWCVEQHMQTGNLNYLIGDHLSYYFLNDSKRAIDYLITRDEIDSNRIGAIGRSGGGTNTAYLCATEERIKLAIPIHFTTNYKRMLAKIPPGDAEQTFLGYIEKGLDIADLYWPFIGKPLLFNLGIKDFFPIEGAREVYQEFSQMYSILGQEEKVAKVEVNIGHQPAKETREACYNWVNRWFGKGKARDREEEVEVLGERELFCTEAGNIAKLGKTVFQINIAKYNELKKNHNNIVPQEEFISEINELLGPGNHYFKFDTVIDELNYLEAEGSYSMVTFYDDDENSSTCEFWNRQSNKLMVFLDVNRRFSGLNIKNKSKGYDLLKVNLPGQDITRQSLVSNATGYDEDYQLFLLSILNGEAIIATRIKHTLYGIQYFLDKRADKNYEIAILGTGQGGIIALFTVLLLDEDVTRLIATDYISLYGNIFNNLDYKISYSSLLPDILKKYDLDIVTFYISGLVKDVRLVNLVNEKQELENIHTIVEKYKILRHASNVSFIQDLRDYSSLIT